MALYWDWEDKIGEVEAVNHGETYKYSLYQGNAFLIVLYEYKQDEKDMYNMHGFFVDEAHAKRCLGINKNADGENYNIYDTAYEKWTKIRLNKNKYKYTKKLVDMLIKAFDNINIEIYTE